jgi:hypothetical protein
MNNITPNLTEKLHINKSAIFSHTAIHKKTGKKLDVEYVDGLYLLSLEYALANPDDWDIKRIEG